MKKLNMRRRPISAAVALAVSLSLGLTACGGGGSNVRQPSSPAPAPAPTPPPPPPPPPPSPPPPPAPAPAPQPPIDAQLALTNTYPAHAAGLTGQGITIGVVDTGVMRTNAALTPRVIKDIIYVSGTNNDLTVDDANGHGTWVAQIAAGQPFASFAGGIAPGADIVSARIIDDKESDGTSTSGGLTYAQEISQLNQVNTDMINNGVKVENNSWGGLTWTDPSIGQQIGATYQNFIVTWGGLVVFAAGNDSKVIAEGEIASLPQDVPSLEQGWIVAAALDSNNPTQLASYSNQCGVAMNYCISAPGDVIVLDKDTKTTTSNPTYYIVEGTSFAAPEVSGAAALVWQAYPYFSNDLVRQTLLGTATDLGKPGVDAVFGWGALNVGAAVNGPEKFDWGDVSVSFDTISSTWGNDIVGAGGLSKDGTGTLVLAGHNSYSGDTNVLGGTLQSAFVMPGNVNVANGAWLTGMYASGATAVGLPAVNGNLDNSGNVLVAGGDATITGNYAQSASGTLSVRLGSVMNVSGTATLDGTLNINGAESGYVTNSHQDVLTAGGGVSGTFANFTLSSGVFLSSTPQYDANSVWLDTTSLSITTTMSTAGYSADPLVMGSAQRVDNAFQQINRQLATYTSGDGGNLDLPAGFIQGAGAIQHTASFDMAALSMRTLSGELHAASAAMALQGIEASTDGLTRRMDALDAYGHVGMWTQDTSVSGDLGISAIDGVGFQFNGWMFGGDRALGSHGVIGYALGQSQGEARLDTRLDRDSSRTTQTLAYAGWHQGGLYARGQVGFGQYRQNISRQLLLGYRWMPVSTWYDGSYRTAYGESGMHFGHGVNRISPYVNVDYTRLDRNGFAEQGGYGFGLKAGGQTLDRWQAGGGVRAAHRLVLGQERWLDFTAHAQWQRTLLAHGDVFDASFVGVDHWQPLVGVGLSPTSVQYGVGMNAQLNPRSALKFDVDTQIGQRVRARQVMLRYALTF